MWEFFDVGRASGGKVTLLSYHGKYVSAQPDGRIEVNRDRAQGWEFFKVLGGRKVVESDATGHSSAGASGSSSDPADAIVGKVLIRGHHSFFVSANATCKEDRCGDSETIDVIKVAPNLVAFRSYFGKYLSGLDYRLCHFQIIIKNNRIRHVFLWALWLALHTPHNCGNFESRK